MARIEFIGLVLALGAGQPACAKTFSWPVVYRDHLKQISVDTVVTAKMWDSTAGSWTGSLPSQGVSGLPTAPPTWDTTIPSWNPDYGAKYRHPLSPLEAVVGWPGRIAARLDILYDTTSIQRCSGSMVGPRHFLTAAHCVKGSPTDGTIQDYWISDSFGIRPGFNLGKSYPGFDRVRVLKTWLSKSKFPTGTAYVGDDDWALLELDQDVGTRLGWSRVIPIDYSNSAQFIHFLGYPLIPPYCPTGVTCVRQTTKTDTLCHSWGGLNSNFSQAMQGWWYLADSWEGESGSGALQCPDDSCHTGKINVIGTMWTNESINAIDSVMSGVIAAILKDVKVPTSSILPSVRSAYAMHLEGGFLQASSEQDGEWQILSLDGQTIGAPSFGKSFTVATDHLPHGVALIVFRSPGQAPFTRQWVVR